MTRCYRKASPYIAASLVALAFLTTACGEAETGEQGATPTAPPEPTATSQPTAAPPTVTAQDPAEAAATAIAGADGYQTPEEAVEAYAEEWPFGGDPAPFLSDCDSQAPGTRGSCLAASREVSESEATYRLCVAGTDACLVVTFVRGSDGLWTLSRVASGSPGPEQQLVP